MKARLEWFPHYPQRFRNGRKTCQLTAQQVGIYWMLYGDEWINGPLDGDLPTLSHVCNGAPEDDVGFVLRKCWEETPDGWCNPILSEIKSEQEKKHRKLSRAGKAGAEARHGKGKNGNRIATPRPSHSHPMPIEESRVDKSRVDKKRDTTRTRTSYSDEFESLWRIHRRGPKAKAFAEYKKTDKPHIEIVTALESYVRHELHERFSGHDLFRWIRDERWEQEEGRAPKPNGKPTAAGIGREIDKLREAGVVQ